MTKRAVLYARVSSDDRGNDGRNLEGQLDLCRQHALAKEWRVVAELAEDDRGASGAELNLPQLTKMLDMAESGEFDILVVREIDRLSRNLAKQLFIEDELKQFGVHVEYVLGEYADTPEGNFLKNVRAAVAELERMKIIERTARGRRQSVKAGNVNVSGRPPYGYEVAEVDGRRTLQAREDEAKIVRLIFQWFTVGDGNEEPLALAAIARKLTDMGVPTYSQKRGKAAYGLKVTFPGLWTPGTLHKVLKNESYTGKWRYGKRRRINGKYGYTEPAEHDLVEVDAIIDMATWNAAQARLEHNRKHAARNRKYDYLMSKRLTCGMCGAGMAGTYRKKKSGKMYHYYICCAKATPQRYPHTCNSAYYRGDHLDSAVWKWVRQLLTDPELLTIGLQAQQEKQTEQNASSLEQIQSYDDLLADKAMRVERLLDLYLDGGISKEVWQERKERIDGEIAHLEEERAAVQNLVAAETITDEQIRTIQEFAATIAEGLDLTDNDFGAKRKIIEMLDVRAKLYKTDDGDKVAHVSCFFDEKQLYIASTTTSGLSSSTPTTHPSTSAAGSWPIWAATATSSPQT